ncbi:MAG: DUF4422 domain-containing protein [Lachnospiraceae bacterium]|nr:DUF4422 domain-containing protein [Lachnospiraceae bacterium]
MTNRIYIFGAHSRAQTLGVYLAKLNKSLSIEAYLVDNYEPNPKMISDIPVISIDKDTGLNIEYPVYLGVRGVYHSDIITKLKSMGMKQIIPVTLDLDMELRNQFLEVHYAEQNRKFEKLDAYCAKSSAKLYVIKSAFDKPLQQEYRLTAFEEELQVGAQLTDSKICELADNIGENISEKNKQFCELTGIYWIWKHAKEDIVGVEHYRRHFILADDWKDRMMDNQIDVILPTPLYVSPSLAQNYRDRHVASDWQFMLQYVKETKTEIYDKMNRFFEETSLYSPCNMFIMRKEVLNELCEWMFPIIFACAEHIGEREDSYQKRYPGFLAERLMTFYFEMNREKYKVVYVDKNFLA